MKNWKDKVLGIFAVIGVMSLLMASNSNPQETQETQGKWQLVIYQSSFNGKAVKHMNNTITGEVYEWYNERWIKISEAITE